MQAQRDFVPVDEFQVGLDRARITRAAQIQLPETHETQGAQADGYSPESPPASSHNVVDSMKAKKHRAGLKIRKTLHIGRSSDDFEHTTTALVGAASEGSGSRYMTDAPEPDEPTMKDFLHNPIDTVKAKISEKGNQQVAGQITAKEIPHGDEVDLMHASDAVEHARDDAHRLLAIEDLSRLMKERQATYARWTFDRHITKIRRLPRGEIKLRPRSDFEKLNPQAGMATDWKAYLLVYYAHQYGGQYIGYGSDPPAPSKETVMPNIERLLLASSPIQEFVMTSREIYRWEQPAETLTYLLIYATLWYFDMLLPGSLAACMYLVFQRRTHGNTLEDLREDIKHREDQHRVALSLTELIVKEGDKNWSDKIVEDLGPWLMVQLADLANFFESLRSFYEWRDPHRTLYAMIVLGTVTLATALTPMWLLVKTMTFGMGVSFFALYPIAVKFPEYRLLVSPAKRFLWNIPTHAEWAVKYVQAEGTELAQKSIPVASSLALPSPTFDMEHDYNSYSASHDNTSGRLIISRSGLRFVSNFGHNVLWNVQFDQLEKIEKVDRVVTKNIPGKLQEDSGKDLRFISRSGKICLLKKVDKRDEAFSQIVGFSNITWQVLW
ncbi:hypothetical protein P171DRAFT_500312 [Karstenula rhodostoma CBS 690.94]|uniref:GRAM domain-containing protein n=1 Tax=Karstenula rhodostoma CBS 690.94 TaxID=1392251 RepID=A0A9P4PD09_9PLEO|nr:hypothetical protein P171DRAFT_500312 [Karstenula rhodostoma CBS 690.94]